MNNPTDPKVLNNPKTPDTRQNQTANNRIFPKTNLWMMGICLLMIIVGFLLMSGGSSSIENGFNPDIFSFRRIVLGPTIAFLGFLCMAFAIIINPGKRKNKSETDNQN